MGKLIGYARTNRRCDLNKMNEQDRKLREAGCSRTFCEYCSGSGSIRFGLAQAILALEEGDTLVVENMSRISRDMKTLRDALDWIFVQGAGLKSLSDDIEISAQASEYILDYVYCVVREELNWLRNTLAADGTHTEAETVHAVQ